VLNLKKLPVRMSRKEAAALISFHYFAVSPRSLERWPLTRKFLNRRIMLETREFVAEAERRLAAAGPLPDRGTLPNRPAATASVAPAAA
jgi:hypothetical protein